ncbi:MAG: hypothetical protein RL148_2925 [Planctomycetota bacterium]|jgi:uncharacterized Rmd1/YagE family protein
MGGVPITAIALDQRVDLATVSARMGLPERRRLAYAVVHDAPGGGCLWTFAFGAVVHDYARELDAELRKRIEQATGARFLQETSETYTVSVDPQHSPVAPRVGWDQVVIPERSAELLGAVALLMAQSAALERYERAADTLLDQVLVVARDLASLGRLPMRTRELVRRIGQLMRDRLELARWFYLADRPEGTWEHPRVAEVYDALFTNLELAQRHAAMLHKLAACESATDSVVDLWQGRRSRFLEWGILVLIVVEILLAVVGWL